MDLRRISGLVMIFLAVALALEYFNIFTLGLPFFMLGALILVIHQGWALIRNVTSTGFKAPFGVIIPLIFASAGLLYFFPIPFFPSIIISNLKILIAAFLFTEGLYSLH